MPPLARRNLFHDKVRLFVTLTGIAFSVVLMVVQWGLFQGFSTSTSSIIDNSGADLWVTAKNVAYIDQAIALHDPLNRFLRQGVNDGFLVDQSWELLAKTLAAPALTAKTPAAKP